MKKISIEFNDVVVGDPCRLWNDETDMKEILNDLDCIHQVKNVLSGDYIISYDREEEYGQLSNLELIHESITDKTSLVWSKSGKCYLDTATIVIADNMMMNYIINGIPGYQKSVLTHERFMNASHDLTGEYIDNPNYVSEDDILVKLGYEPNRPIDWLGQMMSDNNPFLTLEDYQSANNGGIDALLRSLKSYDSSEDSKDDSEEISSIRKEREDRFSALYNSGFYSQQRKKMINVASPVTKWSMAFPTGADGDYDVYTASNSQGEIVAIKTAVYEDCE